ncbi:tetratricopeptide repeat protein [Sneathiella sp. HT1-7]|uniref:tetratricopeptide repeat protein n=1 Tax=Sneathiella sp. HT1-7 TaxID=2887192 RepID=UPI001D142BCE|nr:tetratricopeptide repeat protein [Sneathiella sp. HT1-7]MCC3304839.1 tetratricopeptide repeat protein [Sneathiella sp. HT1-7]
MADIFNEVDEDVRKDKSLALWKTYGNYVIALAVLIVAGTAAYVGWQNYTQSQSRTQGAEFEAAAALVTSEKLGEGAAAFAGLAESGNAGYRPLAALREAEAMIAAGEGEKALLVYEQIAADSSVDAEFSSLANLLAGYYLLDAGTTEQVRERIAPLTEPGSLWSASANELLALSYIKDGDSAKAKEVLALVQNDAAAPEDVKARVTQLLAAIEGM